MPANGGEELDDRLWASRRRDLAIGCNEYCRLVGRRVRHDGDLLVAGKPVAVKELVVAGKEEPKPGVGVIPPDTSRPAGGTLGVEVAVQLDPR
ncbi:MAG TPA: hypothetical protein VGP10_01315 [Marisediminicola sp.]|nr:hypothetical protein [Marisediminicola sp.]